MTDPVLVGMAFLPERRRNAHRVRSDLEAQASPTRPVTVRTYEGTNGRGDAMKFQALATPPIAPPFYYLAVDDDLYYPPDYIARTVEAVERYDRQAAVSYHGGIYAPTPIASYYRGGRAQAFRCLGAVARDTPVNNLGTGTLAFHSDLIAEVDLDVDFPAANMADIWFSLLCKRRGIPMVALAHRAGWIRHQEIDHRTTIHTRYANNDRLQTDIINQNAPWPVVRVRQTEEAQP